jgi:hypothetical protein
MEVADESTIARQRPCSDSVSHSDLEIQLDRHMSSVFAAPMARSYSAVHSKRQMSLLSVM